MESHGNVQDLFKESEEETMSSDKFTNQYEESFLGTDLSTTAEKKNWASKSSRSKNTYELNSLKYAYQKMPFRAPLSKKKLQQSHIYLSNPSAEIVLSERKMEIKDLESQVCYLKDIIKELKIENKTLNDIQARQERELKKYKTGVGDIPSLLKAHKEEVKALESTISSLKNDLKECQRELKSKHEAFLKKDKQLEKHITTLRRESQNNLDLTTENKELKVQNMKLNEENYELKHKIELMKEKIQRLTGDTKHDSNLIGTPHELKSELIFPMPDSKRSDPTNSNSELKQVKNEELSLFEGEENQFCNADLQPLDKENTFASLETSPSSSVKSEMASVQCKLQANFRDPMKPFVKDDFNTISNNKLKNSVEDFRLCLKNQSNIYSEDQVDIFVRGELKTCSANAVPCFKNNLQEKKSLTNAKQAYDNGVKQDVASVTNTKEDLIFAQKDEVYVINEDLKTVYPPVEFKKVFPTLNFVDFSSNNCKEESDFKQNLNDNCSLDGTTDFLFSKPRPKEALNSDPKTKKPSSPLLSKTFIKDLKNAKSYSLDADKFSIKKSKPSCSFTVPEESGLTEKNLRNNTFEVTDSRFSWMPSTVSTYNTVQRNISTPTNTSLFASNLSKNGDKYLFNSQTLDNKSELNGEIFSDI